jgi:hypothetical protein
MLPGARHVRHRPEQTLLYQLVEQHYPAFLDHLAAESRGLPEYVQQEFEDYLKCGRLEHGFLRVRCEVCHDEKLVAFSCKGRAFCPSCGARRMADSAALLVDDILPQRPFRQWVLSLPFLLRFLLAAEPQLISPVLGIAYRHIADFLINQAGLTRTSAATGAVTLIQWFGGAINLNVHFHLLLLDGVYLRAAGTPVFRHVRPPHRAALDELLKDIAEATGAYLERHGWLTRDAENTTLTRSPGDTIEDLMAHAITYRIAVGPHRGQKAFTLQTVTAASAQTELAGKTASYAGFSLHAGVAADSHQRDRLERLCRYITRPPVATDRLALTPNGLIRYAMKTPWKNGTTHLLFEPLDFMGRLAALVPKPRINLIRYHGVFAPNSALRVQVTPARRGRRPTADTETRTPAERRAAMTWAQRLKRVFNIDIETCEHCGGAVKIIASIEDPAIIRRILEHLERRDPARCVSPPARAPPCGASEGITH